MDESLAIPTTLIISSRTMCVDARTQICRFWCDFDLTVRKNCGKTVLRVRTPFAHTNYRGRPLRSTLYKQ